MRRWTSLLRHASTAASSRQNESATSFAGSLTLRKRSMEINPSRVSRCERRASPMSMYFCAFVGQDSKIMASHIGKYIVSSGSLLPSGPLPPLRSSVGPLHFGDADLVVRVPALLAELLCHQMPGVLLPGADRGLVDEIRNRDAKPLLTARALRAKAARLLERKFIHRLRHRLVAIVAFA